MKVSVICLADRAERLPVLVWSMVAQTHTDWELLILDQTPDDEHVDNYIYELPRSCHNKVWVIKCHNVGDWGQTAKEEAAHNHASGDAYMFPNDDAYYTPIALENMVAVLEQGCDIAVCSWLYDRMGYLPMQPSTHEGRVDVGGFMLRKSIFNKVGWANKSQVGDARLLAACIAAGGLVGTSPSVLYVKN